MALSPTARRLPDLLRFQFSLNLLTGTHQASLPPRLGSPISPPVISNLRDWLRCQRTAQVLTNTQQREKKSHDTAPHPHPPSASQTLPLPSATTGLHTIRDRRLCTSPFSPSVSASLPPFPRLHPAPLHPANGSHGEGREEKEQSRFKHVGTHLSHTEPPFLLSLLHDRISLRANARDHAGKKDFSPSSMKRIAKSSAIQHHRLSHQHEQRIHMLHQKLLARQLTSLGARTRRGGESQF